DGQIAEEDVADDLAVFLGDQGGPDVSANTEGIDQEGLVLLPERQAIHLVDRRPIGAGFGADDRAHGRGPRSRNSFRATALLRSSSLAAKTKVTGPSLSLCLSSSRRSPFWSSSAR